MQTDINTLTPGIYPPSPSDGQFYNKWLRLDCLIYRPSENER